MVENKIKNLILILLSLVVILITYMSLTSPKFFSNIMIYSLLLSAFFLLCTFLVNKFKIKKKRLLGDYLSIFLLSFISIFCISLLSVFVLAFPTEPQAVNLEPFEIEFNFYIVNNEITQEDLLGYLSEAKDIWGGYNISILVGEISNVDINLTEQDRNFLYTNISERKTNEENEEICNEKYIPLIKNITQNHLNRSIIFVNGEGNSGRANLCNYHFIIFKTEKNSILDLTGWNLAHEIGHILRLEDLRNSNKMNLMNDKFKIFYKISDKTSFLNQSQLKTIIAKRGEEDY